MMASRQRQQEGHPTEETLRQLIKEMQLVVHCMRIKEIGRGGRGTGGDMAVVIASLVGVGEGCAVCMGSDDR